MYDFCAMRLSPTPRKIQYEALPGGNHCRTEILINKALVSYCIRYDYPLPATGWITYCIGDDNTEK